jgi:hypothetical protein
MCLCQGFKFLSQLENRSLFCDYFARLWQALPATKIAGKRKRKKGKIFLDFFIFLVKIYTITTE